MLILGIESSCDETAGAICRNGEIISNVVLSQVIHKQFGGVVPEIASREHDSQITSIIQKTLDKANITLSDIEAIAVTYGAGLMGALLVGLNYAKGLSIALKIPFIGVNHLEGHLYASFISFPDMKYPYLCLLVTGGHTQIWEVQSPGNYVLHSQTLDDAAGEAFDKSAKLLGLSYPGGPALAALAEKGRAGVYKLPRPMLRSGDLEFSFSGLKTAVLTLVRQCSHNGQIAIDEQTQADIAFSAQEAIVDVLTKKSLSALDKTGLNRLVVAGGVGANSQLRERLNADIARRGGKVFYPNLEFCTDNGAMIAFAGALRFAQQQGIKEYRFNVKPRWDLQEIVLQQS